MYTFIFRFISLFLVIGLLAGCSTYYGAAVVRSEPSGAKVYDMEDGFYIGVTPVKHVWRTKDTRSKFMNVRLQKSGFEDEFSSFWLNMDHRTKGQAAKSPQDVKFELKKSDS